MTFDELVAEIRAEARNRAMRELRDRQATVLVPDWMEPITARFSDEQVERYAAAMEIAAIRRMEKAIRKMAFPDGL